MSARTFQYGPYNEIYEYWRGHASRISRWLDAPYMLAYDNTLTDEQRQQIKAAIRQYDEVNNVR
jgi:hypothetical protein